MKSNKLRDTLYKKSRVTPSPFMQKSFEQQKSKGNFLYPAFALAFSLLVVIVLSPPFQNRNKSDLTFQDMDRYIEYRLQLSEQFDQTFLKQVAIDNEYQMMDTDGL